MAVQNKSLLTASLVSQLRGFILLSSAPCSPGRSELLFMTLSPYWPNSQQKLLFYNSDYSVVLLAHNSVSSSLSFLTAALSSASLASTHFTSGSSIMYYFITSIPAVVIFLSAYYKSSKCRYWRQPVMWASASGWTSYRRLRMFKPCFQPVKPPSWPLTQNTRWSLSSKAGWMTSAAE